MEILKLAQDVQNGNVQPLPAYVALKEIEAELKQAMAIVQSLAISDADKYPGKQIDLGNAVIEKRSAPATWDYSHIPAVSTYQEKVKYIQKLAQMGGGIDPETGEVIDKAYKIAGKSTIAVTLKKQEA